MKTHILFALVISITELCICQLPQRISIPKSLLVPHIKQPLYKPQGPLPNYIPTAPNNNHAVRPVVEEPVDFPWSNFPLHTYKERDKTQSLYQENEYAPKINPPPPPPPPPSADHLHIVPSPKHKIPIVNRYKAPPATPKIPKGQGRQIQIQTASQASIPRLINPGANDERIKSDRKRKPIAQILKKYRTDNADGSITWGYENDDGSFKEETLGVDCITRGKYGYVDPDGVRREYSYETGNKCDDEDLIEDEKLENKNNAKLIPSSHRKLNKT